jgi:hypothetical protein
MGKAEILAELTANGQVNIFRSSPSWQKAFELYKKVNGGHKNMHCGSCYREVLQWLRS